MSFRLFLCKLGFHKWEYYKRPVNIKDSEEDRENTYAMECRRCAHCEKVEESVFGYTWKGKFRVF
jgi:hypothetical protein